MALDHAIDVNHDILAGLERTPQVKASGVDQCHTGLQAGSRLALLEGAFLPDDSMYLSGYECDPVIYADGFFDDVDYIGAFRSRNSAWVWGWTEFNQDW